MTALQIKFKKLHPRAASPYRATNGAAAVDLVVVDVAAMRGAALDDSGVALVAVSRARTFRTGLAVEIPAGYGMFILSRSGQGFTYDVRLANAVGLIDSDYRGEVLVKLANDRYDAGDVFIVHEGDRIAQAVIMPIPEVEFIEVEELSDTARGAGGFGHSGK